MPALSGVGEVSATPTRAVHREIHVTSLSDFVHPGLNLVGVRRLLVLSLLGRSEAAC
jgi:hypothetical protein